MSSLHNNLRKACHLQPFVIVPAVNVFENRYMSYEQGQLPTPHSHFVPSRTGFLPNLRSQLGYTKLSKNVWPRRHMQPPDSDHKESRGVTLGP